MIVGIDLGTTNCSIHYFDKSLKRFEVAQEGYGKLPLLPSFLYLGEKELIGQMAKKEGAVIPTRLVHSAKSWLANPVAEREEAILPIDFDQKQISPVEATRRLLAYIREKWDEEHEGLDEQEVIITLPASFDERARRLTLKAAKMAGLPKVHLIEEPLAAFYAWMEKGYVLPHGSKIVVCDVGGGTTDFTLIEAVENGFRRMAVGRHLLLGGDNIDHALAHKIGCSNVHAVREAKEKLLSGQESVSFFVAGEGASVIGSGKRYTLTKDDFDIDGFFGIEPFERAAQIEKSSAIKTVGLAFEREPSITKQLASFLASCKTVPTHVLFNGGALKPELFRERIVAALNSWFGKVEVLESDDLEGAVSRGAVFSRLYKEKKIDGGSPRGYYLQLDVDGVKKALSIIPRGSDEGTKISVDHPFLLRTNQEVSFQLLSSHTRLFDSQGTLIDIDPEEMLPLSPLYTMLKLGKKKEAAVQLQVQYTELGTLEIELASRESDHRWKLEFSCRSEEPRRVEDSLQVGEIEPAQKLITEAFSPGQFDLLKGVMKRLEECFGKPKQEWSPSILRKLFETLIEQASKRSLSQEYAQRFWNLAGFFLRPGFGHPLDECRTQKLWKLHLEDSAQSEEVETQKWIAMRRISAGLSKGQQIQLFNLLMPQIWTKKRGLVAKEEYLFSEKLRLVASLELVNHDQKIKLGKALITRLKGGKGKPFDFWALGRLGARQPLYGTLVNILPQTICQDWVEELLESPGIDEKELGFTLLHLARKSDMDELNLSTELVETIESRFSVDLSTPLSHEQQERFFGDALPSALTLKSE